MTAHELFPALARACKKAHEDYGLTGKGHDFGHDLAVASYAYVIAPDERTGRLGVAAGFCHSADHMVAEKFGVHYTSAGKNELESMSEFERLVRELLETADLTVEEKNEVVHVVLHHEGANKESDPPLQITLVDADRLANMDATVIARGGQFHPDLPVVDPVLFENDPTANYRNPKSLAWDIENCAKWADETGPYILRLPKARELGRTRAAFLRLYIQTIKDQQREAGLLPYPEV